jgi:capsular polysaccharide biosynthesis protein
MCQKEKSQKEKSQIEDEISLMDYLNVILKRKWLISLTFVLAMIGAGVFSYFLPRIYRAETVLKIGEVRTIVDGQPHWEAIEEPIQIVEKFRLGIYEELIRTRLGIAGENLRIKAESPGGTRLVRIEVEYTDPEPAKMALEEISNLILSDHQGLIRAEVELLRDIRPTRVIKAPILPEAPIEPRLALNISIAGILGIFFGTFFAFFREFLEKNKKLKKS